MNELLIPIRKIDEEKRLIYGRAVQEIPDRSGEILDYATAVPAFREWSKRFEDATGGLSKGNLRVMHGKVVAGKVTDLSFNDNEKAIDVVAKVVDDNEWQKCLEGVYTGFSVGGSYLKKWNDGNLKRYTPRVAELSLVDSPCIPTARIYDLVKADGAIEQHTFKSAELVDFIDEMMESLSKEKHDGAIEEILAKRSPDTDGGKVAATMSEFKAGTLKSGSGAAVTDRKQAIAIALSQARKVGEDVAPEPDAEKADATDGGDLASKKPPQTFGQMAGKKPMSFADMRRMVHAHDIKRPAAHKAIAELVGPVHMHSAKGAAPATIQRFLPAGIKLVDENAAQKVATFGDLVKLFSLTSTPLPANMIKPKAPNFTGQKHTHFAPHPIVVPVGSNAGLPHYGPTLADRFGHRFLTGKNLIGRKSRFQSAGTRVPGISGGGVGSSGSGSSGSGVMSTGSGDIGGVAKTFGDLVEALPMTFGDLAKWGGSWDSSKHPRVPSGQGGGEFSSDGGGPQASAATPASAPVKAPKSSGISPWLAGAGAAAGAGALAFFGRGGGSLISRIASNPMADRAIGRFLGGSADKAAVDMTARAAGAAHTAAKATEAVASHPGPRVIDETDGEFAARQAAERAQAPKPHPGPMVIDEHPAIAEARQAAERGRAAGQPKPLGPFAVIAEHPAVAEAHDAAMRAISATKGRGGPRVIDTNDTRPIVPQTESWLERRSGAIGGVRKRSLVNDFFGPLEKDFDESKHPRASDGQFSGGSSGGSQRTPRSFIGRQVERVVEHPVANTLFGFPGAYIASRMAQKKAKAAGRPDTITSASPDDYRTSTKVLAMLGGSILGAKFGSRLAEKTAVKLAEAITQRGIGGSVGRHVLAGAVAASGRVIAPAIGASLASTAVRDPSVQKRSLVGDFFGPLEKWDESEHPRADDGTFTSGGGGRASGKGFIGRQVDLVRQYPGTFAFGGVAGVNLRHLLARHAAQVGQGDGGPTVHPDEASAPSPSSRGALSNWIDQHSGQLAVGASLAGFAAVKGGAALAPFALMAMRSLKQRAIMAQANKKLAGAITNKTRSTVNDLDRAMDQAAKTGKITTVKKADGLAKAGPGWNEADHPRTDNGPDAGQFADKGGGGKAPPPKGGAGSGGGTPPRKPAFVRALPSDLVAHRATQATNPAYRAMTTDVIPETRYEPGGYWVGAGAGALAGGAGTVLGSIPSRTHAGLSMGEAAVTRATDMAGKVSGYGIASLTTAAAQQAAAIPMRLIGYAVGSKYPAAAARIARVANAVGSRSIAHTVGLAGGAAGLALSRAGTRALFWADRQIGETAARALGRKAGPVALAAGGAYLGAQALAPAGQWLGATIQPFMARQVAKADGTPRTALEILDLTWNGEEGMWKASFDESKHPRVPSGQHGGGEFAAASGGGGKPAVAQSAGSKAISSVKHFASAHPVMTHLLAGTAGAGLAGTAVAVIAGRKGRAAQQLLSLFSPDAAARLARGGVGGRVGGALTQLHHLLSGAAGAMQKKMAEIATSKIYEAAKGIGPAVMEEAHNIALQAVEHFKKATLAEKAYIATTVAGAIASAPYILSQLKGMWGSKKVETHFGKGGLHVQVTTTDADKNVYRIGGYKFGAGGPEALEPAILAHKGESTGLAEAERGEPEKIAETSAGQSYGGLRPAQTSQDRAAIRKFHGKAINGQNVPLFAFDDQRNTAGTNRYNEIKNSQSDANAADFKDKPMDRWEAMLDVTDPGHGNTTMMTRGQQFSLLHHYLTAGRDDLARQFGKVQGDDVVKALHDWAGKRNSFSSQEQKKAIYEYVQRHPALNLRENEKNRQTRLNELDLIRNTPVVNRHQDQGGQQHKPAGTGGGGTATAPFERHPSETPRSGVSAEGVRYEIDKGPDPHPPKGLSGEARKLAQEHSGYIGNERPLSDEEMNDALSREYAARMKSEGKDAGIDQMFRHSGGTSHRRVVRDPFPEVDPYEESAANDELSRNILKALVSGTLAKVYFDASKHPREGRGSPIGGEFSGGDGQSDAASASAAKPLVAPKAKVSSLPGIANNFTSYASWQLLSNIVDRFAPAPVGRIAGLAVKGVKNVAELVPSTIAGNEAQRAVGSATGTRAVDPDKMSFGETAARIGGQWGGSIALPAALTLSGLATGGVGAVAGIIASGIGGAAGDEIVGRAYHMIDRLLGGNQPYRPGVATPMRAAQAINRHLNRYGDSGASAHQRFVSSPARVRIDAQAS